MKSTINKFKSWPGYIRYLPVLMIIYGFWCLFALWPGLYFETGSDVYFRNLNLGMFTGVSESVVGTFGCYIFIHPLTAYLHACMPGVPWFDLMLLFFISLISLNTFIIIRTFSAGAGVFASSLLTGLIIFNLLHVETLRLAFLLTATGLILLYAGMLNSRAGLLYAYACIALGLMIRLEAGSLAIVLVSVYYFILSADRWRVFRLGVPVLVVLSLVVIRVNTPLNDSEEQYLNIRPYQFTLWDYGNVHDLKGLDARVDSIKYQTARAFFLADSEELTPAFFAGIGVKKTDKTPGDMLNYFSGLDTEKLLHYGKEYGPSYYWLLFAWLVLLVGTFVMSSGKWIATLNFVLFSASIVFLALFMKMEERLLVSLMSLAIILLLLFHQEKRSVIISGMAMLLLSVQMVTGLASYYRSSAEQHRAMETVREGMKDLPDKSLVMVHLLPFIHWNTKVFEQGQRPENIELFSLDNGFFFVQPGQQQYLENLFATTVYREIFFQLEHSDRDVFILSDSVRASLMGQYCSEVYGLEWEAKLVHTFHPGKSGIHEILLYKLERLPVTKGT